MFDGLAVDFGVAGVATQDDIAGQVLPGVVVVQTLVQPDDRPLPLTRAQVPLGDSTVVGAVGVGVSEHLSPGRDDGQNRRAGDPPVGHGEGLEVGEVWPGRLQAVFGEAGGDVVTGGPPAGRAGLAATQFVAGQVFQVFQRPLLVEHAGEGGVVGGGHQRPYGDLRRDGLRRYLRAAGDDRARRRQLELGGGDRSGGLLLERGRPKQDAQVDQDGDLDEGQDDDRQDDRAMGFVAQSIHWYHITFYVSRNHVSRYGDQAPNPSKDSPMVSCSSWPDETS